MAYVVSPLHPVSQLAQAEKPVRRTSYVITDNLQGGFGFLVGVGYQMGSIYSVLLLLLNGYMQKQLETERVMTPMNAPIAVSRMPVSPTAFAYNFCQVLSKSKAFPGALPN